MNATVTGIAAGKTISFTANVTVKEVKPQKDFAEDFADELGKSVEVATGESYCVSEVELSPFTQKRRAALFMASFRAGELVYLKELWWRADTFSIRKTLYPVPKSWHRRKDSKRPVWIVTIKLQRWCDSKGSE